MDLWSSTPSDVSAPRLQNLDWAKVSCSLLAFWAFLLHNLQYPDFYWFHCIHLPFWSDQALLSAWQQNFLQSEKGQLSASSLSADFCRCRTKLLFSLSENQNFSSKGDISSFAFTPVHLILKSFWDQLDFRNNTQPKGLKRAVSYRCVFYVLLEYKRGKAHALLVLITPLWSSASKQCYFQHCP